MLPFSPRSTGASTGAGLPFLRSYVIGALQVTANLERSRRFHVSSDDFSTSGVAGRYASSLYELAKDSKALEIVEQGLSTVQGLLDSSEDFHRMVRSPVHSASEQAAAIAAIASKAGITGLAANFLQVMAKNRRLFVLPETIKAFQAMVARDRGEVSAEVVSAHPLSEAQQSQLLETLTSSTGKIIKMKTKVDPSLLGGMVVKVGSRMIDSSLRTKLDALKVAMKGTG